MVLGGLGSLKLSFTLPRPRGRNIRPGGHVHSDGSCLDKPMVPGAVARPSTVRTFIAGTGSRNPAQHPTLCGSQDFASFRNVDVPGVPEGLMCRVPGLCPLLGVRLPRSVLFLGVALPRSVVFLRVLERQGV